MSQKGGLKRKTVKKKKREEKGIRARQWVYSEGFS